MEKALIALAAALVLTVIGAVTAISQGKTATKAMESIARQPESAGNLRTAMIIAAGMIEGAALFAIIVCLLALVL